MKTFSGLSFQGEPGYVIAGTDANFVPGRKGEPGSLVSFDIWLSFFFPLCHYF